MLKGSVESERRVQSDGAGFSKRSKIKASIEVTLPTVATILPRCLKWLVRMRAATTEIQNDIAGDPTRGTEPAHPQGLTRVSSGV